jgi:two-component system, NarL family, nitrate/nitrite response regulator NarL
VPGSLADTRAPIRLLVVDDHPIVRDGVAMLVQRTPWVEIVGYAPNGREALDCARDLKPDVVLLDLRLPDMLGSEIVRGIHACVPNATIVVFTAFADHAAISATRAAGASALLLKDASAAEMLELLGCIRAGKEIPWSGDPAEVERRRSSTLAQLGLTRREYDVLRRVALGETNPEIAKAMNLSRNTVKSYLQTALSKLGARNRVEALVRAGELDLL